MAPAKRLGLPDGTTFGIIASTTTPFCQSCDRGRLTADGVWYLCLCAQSGVDLRRPLREGVSAEELKAQVAAAWRGRTDPDAELRTSAADRGVLVGIDQLRIMALPPCRGGMTSVRPIARSARNYSLGGAATARAASPVCRMRSGAPTPKVVHMAILRLQQKRRRRPARDGSPNRALYHMKRSGGGAVAELVRFNDRLGGVPGHCVSITHVPFSRSSHGGVWSVRPPVDRCE